MVNLIHINKMKKALFSNSLPLFCPSDAIVSYAERDNRIVGGEEVIPHSVPHQVALFIDEQYFCGGKSKTI